jgi:hypothetical protein
MKNLVGITLLLAMVACNRSENVAAVKAPEVGALAPAPVTPAPPPPVPVTITAPVGKRLRVRTGATLSTKTARAGETVPAVLAEPLVVDGVVLAKAGAPVTAVVGVSDPGGRVKGVASISVRATRLELADGRTVDVATSSYVRAAPHTKKKDALKVGIGSGIGAAIGAIAGGGKGAAIGAGAGAGAGAGTVMATRGDPAVIPSETLLTLTLRSPITMMQ